MGFNPYNHEAYRNLGRSHNNPIPDSAFSAFTSGYISVINEAAEAQRRVDENERNMQGWYMSQDRRLHKNSKSALEGGLASDMINGQRDCTGNDSWNVGW